MELYDSAKTLKELYTAGKQPKEINVFKGKFFAIEGLGEPGGEEFQSTIEKLYTAAYTVKFKLKNSGIPDFKVSKLECIYDIEGSPQETPKSQWRWSLMIRMPDFIKKKHLTSAQEIQRENGKGVSGVKLLSQKEGLCLQVMHIGKYEEVGKTYDILLEHMKENKLEENGQPHEIYISDPHRTKPENLKTIVRIPVKKKK